MQHFGKPALCQWDTALQVRAGGKLFQLVVAKQLLNVAFALWVIWQIKLRTAELQDELHRKAGPQHVNIGGNLGGGLWHWAGKGSHVEQAPFYNG
jgi:hypothetical protein